jgi:cytochrome c
MKKIFIVLCISAVITACGGSSKTGNSTDTPAAANQAAKAAESSADTNAGKTGTESTAAPSDPGAKLMAGSDCNTCHKVDTKVVGPALADIAAKYPPTSSNIDTLTAKVIKGGSGHWGSIPMAPHPQLKAADVKLMVTYILSLKK